MGDDLNIEQPAALLEYLRRIGRLDAQEAPSFTTLAGGVSNRTVLVERAGGGAWVIKQALPKLRVAVNWFSDPARIHQEALGLMWLERLAPPGSVPAFIFEDRGQHLLCMRAVPAPHENWKARLLAGGLELGHVRQFGELLGMIHQRGHQLRSEIGPVFAERSFFESLRLEPYYRFVAAHIPEAAGFIAKLIEDTLATRLTIVHGDYSPKNVLLAQGRLILLDHEVIHFGDPAFDLGFSFTHLLSKGHHLRTQRRRFLEAASVYWTSYRGVAGSVAGATGLEHRAVRHTVACLLARVEGRSPLEYLSDPERRRQREISLALMQDVPGSIPDLIDRFASVVGD